MLVFSGKDLTAYISRIYADISEKDIWAAMNEYGTIAKGGKWQYRVDKEWFEVNDDKEMF
jgi:hypothetical protein